MNLDLPIEKKGLKQLLKKIYGGDDKFDLQVKAKNKIKKYTEQGLSQLPICAAKHISLSDQASFTWSTNVIYC